MSKKPSTLNRQIKKGSLWITFLFLICINIYLYLFILIGHSLLPFNNFNYFYNAHHYLLDERATGGKFNFFRALNQFDAQWYIKIAQEGYPYHPVNTNLNNKKMDGLTYAFFPLYPITVGIINFFVRDIEISAFLLSNCLLIINFFSLYYVLNKVLPEKIVLRTIILLFISPFSIFFRSYFTEGIYLLLLVWFCYCLIRQKWLISSILLGLINVTKANGWLLNIYLLIVLVKKVNGHEISKGQFLRNIFLLVLPSILWLTFTYLQTGNPIYFLSVRATWNNYGIFSIFHNILSLFTFTKNPIHAFHYSRIDDLTIIIFGSILFFSKRKLPPTLWWIGFCLWLSPLLVTDTMSFTRYQAVSFPVFAYISSIKKNWLYTVLIICLLISLFASSLLFVNWYWLG
jgi:Gpi18-like mannosyltransferase